MEPESGSPGKASTPNWALLPQAELGVRALLTQEEPSQLHPRRSQSSSPETAVGDLSQAASITASFPWKEIPDPPLPFVLVAAVSSQALPQLSPQEPGTSRDLSLGQSCPCRCHIPAAGGTSGAPSTCPERCAWAVTALAFRVAVPAAASSLGAPKFNPSRPARRRLPRDALAEPPDVDSFSRWDRPSPAPVTRGGAHPSVLLVDLRF